MANQRINNNIDITKVKHKLIGNLSLRQVIFILIGIILGMLDFWIIGRNISYKAASMILAFLILPPLFLFCESRPQSMPLEKYIWHRLKFKLLPQKRSKKGKGGVKSSDKKQKK